MRTPINHVTKAPDHTRVMGGRVATVYATAQALIDVLGPPSRVDTTDQKVNYRWVVNTPRGPAEIRDYWWNRLDEHTIAAETVPNNWTRGHKAALWVAAALRAQGIPAGRRDKP
jgi:hypothetical protein